MRKRTKTEKVKLSKKNRIENKKERKEKDKIAFQFFLRLGTEVNLPLVQARRRYFNQQLRCRFGKFPAKLQK